VILRWIHDLSEGVGAFLTGMRTTGHYLLENLRDEGGATAVTRQYPAEPAERVGDRQRGHLHNDGERCIVCHACDKVCPVDCFTMDGERDANNKMRASRFDIDLSKCIYCGLCVRACPTDSLSMTADFEVAPLRDGRRYVFTRSSDQLGQRFDAVEMARLHALAERPREQLTAEERQWLDAHFDPRGPHLIGVYGLGYYTAEQKAAVEAERAAKKQQKDAATAAAARAKAAAAAAPSSAAPPAAPAAPSTPAAPAAPPAPGAEPPAGGRA
jgi:NADH-quinone oxidoreductase subunit I